MSPLPPAPRPAAPRRRARWERYRVTGPFSPSDLAKLWGLMGGLVAVALFLGWALEMKGGTIIVLLLPSILLWFDARRVLFQLDHTGVRIGGAELPWHDVTTIVVVSSPALGPQVLIGTRLRDGAVPPAQTQAAPPHPAMPAPLHVAVERRKFDLTRLTAKARRYAPAHVEITVEDAAGALGPHAGASRSPAAPPTPADPNRTPAPGGPGPAIPATPGRRWGIIAGAALTCTAVAALFATAMPLRAFLLDSDQGMFVSMADAMGLAAFPATDPMGGVPGWPWLLAPLLGAVTVAHQALGQHRRSRATSVAGLLCATALPLRLLVSDVVWAPPVSGYEGGWWVLHLGAFVGLAAFVALDLALARGTSDRT
ncbi:hypothetical protein [Streptomyces sp. NPDC003832]